MIRKQTLAAFAAVLGLMVPSSAMALGIVVDSFSSTNAIGNDRIAPGDVLTVNLVLENPTADAVAALGVAARGWDANNDGIANDGLILSGGQVTSTAFAPVPGFGLNNVLGGPDFRGAPAFLPPGHPSHVPATPLHAQIFDGVSVTGFPGDGTIDVGVGPNADVGSGNVHFTLQFVYPGGLTAHTPFTLEFGVFGDLGSVAGDQFGGTLAFSNTSLGILVIPEPGTALLMGLGLAGLATTRRR